MDDKWLFVSNKKIFTIILLVVLAGMIGTGCGLRGKLNPRETGEQTEITNNGKRKLVLSSERSQVLIYFATSNQEYLVPVTIDINPSKELAQVAVEKLLAGPNSDFLGHTIPEGTKLKDIYFAEFTGTVYVDLTNNFLDLAEEKDVLLALNSLVYTLTELPEVVQVQVHVEGETITELHGVPMDKPLAREHGINYLGSSQDEGEEITVFFGDENAMFMVPVTFAAPAGIENIEQAQVALKQLIKGPPKGVNLYPVFWEGTKVLNVDYNEQEKVLVVDFSEEIIGYGGGSTAEIMLTNALVYTLTSLPQVDQVQILIEGEKKDYLPEGTDIYNPLTKPDKCNYN